MTKKVEAMHNYSSLPEDLQDGMTRWIEEGNASELPGFMVACLHNDLMGAIALADNANFQRLPGIMRWIWGYALIDCWGSKEKFENWRSL